MIFLKKQHEKGLSWLITIFIFRQLDINLHLGPDHIQFNCILNFIKPNCRPKLFFIYCITEEMVLEELMVPHISTFLKKITEFHNIIFRHNSAINKHI